MATLAGKKRWREKKQVRAQQLLRTGHQWTEKRPTCNFSVFFSCKSWRLRTFYGSKVVCIGKIFAKIFVLARFIWCSRCAVNTCTALERSGHQFPVFPRTFLCWGIQWWPQSDSGPPTRFYIWNHEAIKWEVSFEYLVIFTKFMKSSQMWPVFLSLWEVNHCFGRFKYALGVAIFLYAYLKSLVVRI